MTFKMEDKRTVLAAFQRAIRVFSQQSPAGQLWIVESDRIRYRQG